MGFCLMPVMLNNECRATGILVRRVRMQSQQNFFGGIIALVLVGVLKVSGDKIPINILVAFIVIVIGVISCSIVGCTA